ncbi:MAG: hypothetical protein WBD31_13760 [Rubripirellula sp.]
MDDIARLVDLRSAMVDREPFLRADGFVFRRRKVIVARILFVVAAPTLAISHRIQVKHKKYEQALSDRFRKMRLFVRNQTESSSKFLKLRVKRRYDFTLLIASVIAHLSRPRPAGAVADSTTEPTTLAGNAIRGFGALRSRLRHLRLAAAVGLVLHGDLIG